MGLKLSKGVGGLLDKLSKDLNPTAIKHLQADLVGFVGAVAGKRFADSLNSDVSRFAQQILGPGTVTNALNGMDAAAQSAIQFAQTAVGGGDDSASVVGLLANATPHPFVTTVHDPAKPAGSDVVSGVAVAGGAVVRVGNLTGVATATGATLTFTDQATGIVYTLPPFWQSRLTAFNTVVTLMLSPVINGLQTVGVQYFVSCTASVVNNVLAIGFIIGQLDGATNNTRVVVQGTYAWSAFAMSLGGGVTSQLTSSSGGNGTTVMRLPNMSLPGVSANAAAGATRAGLWLTYVLANGLGLCVPGSFVSVTCQDTLDSDPDHLPLTITIDGSGGDCQVAPSGLVFATPDPTNPPAAYLPSVAALSCTLRVQQSSGLSGVDVYDAAGTLIAPGATDGAVLPPTAYAVAPLGAGATCAVPIGPTTELGTYLTCTAASASEWAVSNAVLLLSVAPRGGGAFGTLATLTVADCPAGAGTNCSSAAEGTRYWDYAPMRPAQPPPQTYPAPSPPSQSLAALAAVGTKQPARRAAVALAAVSSCESQRVGTLVCAALIAAIALLVLIVAAIALAKHAKAPSARGAAAGVTASSIVLVLSAVVLGLQGAKTHT